MFLQHCRPPQNKTDKWENGKEKQGRENVAKKMQSMGRWRSKSVEGEIPSFCLWLNVLHHSHPIGDVAGWCGLRWTRVNGAFLLPILLELGVGYIFLLNESTPIQEVSLTVGKIFFSCILFDNSSLKFFRFCLQLCSFITCPGRNIL